MKFNEGVLDRILRLLIGAGLVAAGFYAQGATAVVLWVLAAVLVLTGAVGICPLYMLFGLSTKKEAKK